DRAQAPDARVLARRHLSHLGAVDRLRQRTARCPALGSARGRIHRLPLRPRLVLPSRSRARFSVPARELRPQARRRIRALARQGVAQIRAHLRLAAALAVFAAAGNAIAAGPDGPQSYPTRPVRLILPFPPGGPVDGMARVLGPKLSAAFGQSVVLDNRPGASGMIGIDTAVRAAPDGYTITMVSSSYAASAATSQLSHDPLADTAPIVLLGVAPQLA